MIKLLKTCWQYPQKQDSSVNGRSSTLDWQLGNLHMMKLGPLSCVTVVWLWQFEGLPDFIPNVWTDFLEHIPYLSLQSWSFLNWYDRLCLLPMGVMDPSKRNGWKVQRRKVAEQENGRERQQALVCKINRLIFKKEIWNIFLKSNYF